MNKKMQKNRLALLGLMIGLMATTWCGTLSAANYYWDTGTAAGYQPGNGTWETSAFWTLNGTTLTTWPGESTNNAYICTSTGTNVVTISSPVGVNQLGLGWNGSAKTDNNWVTLTNSSITVGAGGIIVDGNKTAAIYSDIVLATNQTWDIRAVALPVYGNVTENGNGFGITKTGASTLSLYGINYFSGDFVQGAGPITIYSASGLPLGSGSLTIGNDRMLSITPAGSGSAVALLGGTNGNETLSFEGEARIYINKGTQSSVNYTFGSTTDTGSVFTRIGKGTLAVGNSTSANPGGKIGDDNGRILIANGATGVPIHNGMVDAYITTETMGSQWNFDFLQYDAVNGLANLTYDGAFTGTSGGINDNTKKYRVTNAQYPILTNNTAVYALTLHQTSSVTLSNNAVLSIGDGVNPAGLIIHIGPIQSAVNSTGSKINFGASEGIVYSGQAASIATPIDGSAGVTFNAGGGGTGAMTLTANNLYTGPTTVLGNQLKVGSGGTSGDLGNSSNLVVYSGATVNFNRSDTFNWAGAISGAGTVQNGGGGTLNLSLSSGTTFGGTIANPSFGTLNLMTSGTNTIAALTSSGAGGRMTFSGAGSVNNIAGTFQGNNATSTNIFTSGSWYFGNPGNSGSSRIGTLMVDGAFVSFAGGRYVSSAGGALIVKAGQLQFLGDRFNPGGDYAGSILIDISGGVLDVAQSQYGFSLGAIGGNHAINLTGGLLQYGFSLGNSAGTANFVIGADTGKLGTNTVSITGGTLLSRFSLSGRITPTASIQQFLNWTGGVLAALGADMTKLGSSDGTTTYASGTLLNGGGTLAPGDLGIPGKTTITGAYSESSVNAALAIDVGGPTQANAFTNGPAFYDYLNVNNGAATVAGRLDVRLINGYTPPANKGFIVLETTGTGAALSGSFANVSGGKVWCADGYSQFDVLFNAPANKVILTNYAGNVWSPTSGNAWTTGANWTQAEPNGNTMAAYFGTGASGAVTLDTARIVRGLTFNNGSAAYTLSGSGSLTLQGDALTAPQMTVLAGSHTINVPVALSNATTFAVDNTSMLTLAGNVTGAQNVTKTGTGTLALSGVNTLGALAISAGTVKQTAGTTTLASLTLAGGTYDLWTGTLLIAEGVAGGAIDTIAEVEAAITAGSLKGRGQTVPVSSFRISVVGGFVTVELKMRGTVISFL